MSGGDGAGPARTIDGRAIAAALRTETASRVEALRAGGVVPTLAVVVPTRDESTAWYVRSIANAAAKVGLGCLVEQLDDADVGTVRNRLAALSADPQVHGLICQTPLPAGVGLADVGDSIDPAKDVDGANPVSAGRLLAGRSTFAPATAAAVLEILRRERVPLSGARVAVVGRSIVVGKPVALLLLAENATVTICHSRTHHLPTVTREADVLVAAVGRAAIIGADYVRPGAVVIDVGTNPTPEGGLVGDVDADAIAAVAGALTPVPGGVGPVTTQLLLAQTVTAAQRSV
jgi:methylenetetrahydrofolate dehydrogenase (NADP+)/methenyltetrahydrofolate cyclohydrolase